MGLLGDRIGGFVADKIEHSKFAKKRPLLARGAGFVARTAGSMTKYEKGGRVTRTEPAMVHSGEYVLPKGVKPTMAQKKAVAKGKAKSKAKKPVRRKVAPKKKKKGLKER